MDTSPDDEPNNTLRMPLNEDAQEVEISEKTPSRYRILPVRLLNTNLDDNTPCWQIELHGASDDGRPIGAYIIGDVVIGRGPLSDIDLALHGNAAGQGVSRKHSMLRPTRRRLHLIDLDSTNGTRVNGMYVDPSQAKPLEDGDRITLGEFTFAIRILERLRLSQLQIQPGSTDDLS